MFEALKGKKLLVIGSSETDKNIVRTAQDMGVYVIACDGTAKSAKTAAKNAADEAWDINYSETEAIAEKCRKAKVDGVIAGYSEFRVLAACRIAAAIGTPFYATEEQIELTRNKRRFKDECVRYGVRVPLDYCFNEPPTEEEIAKMRFPVIVKPTDYAGRKGITVCDSIEQVKPAVEFALGYSESSTVIVEEFVTGTEFAAIYSLSGGEISLSCYNDKYLERDQEKISGLCDLAISPSNALERYTRQTDPSVRAFLRGIGARNGVAFFQGISTGGEFVIFEMGYRLNGGNDCFLIEKNNGINYMKMLISHSLCGSMGDDLSKDDPFFARYYATFLAYAHAGTVKRAELIEPFGAPGILDARICLAPGSRVKEDGSTAQRAFSFKLSTESLEKMAQTIQYIQDHMILEDEEGRNMLFKPFDTSRLFA